MYVYKQIKYMYTLFISLFQTVLPEYTNGNYDLIYTQLSALDGSCYNTF